MQQLAVKKNQDEYRNTDFVPETFIAPSRQKYLKRFQGKWLAAQLQALIPVPAPQPNGYVVVVVVASFISAPSK